MADWFRSLTPHRCVFESYQRLLIIVDMKKLSSYLVDYSTQVPARACGYACRGTRILSKTVKLKSCLVAEAK
jgi:hypothetical protein